MIRSKFSFRVYFFTLLPASFVTLGIVFLFHPQWQFKNKLGATNSAAVPGIILVVLMGGVLFFVLRQIVILSIDSSRLGLDSIRGRQVLDRADIRQIDLWGRTRFNGAPSEAIHITTTDERRLTFTGWSCRNLPKLKKAIQAEYAEFLAHPPENHVRPGVAVEPVVFSGSVPGSINGILFYGILLGFLGFDVYHHLNPIAQPVLWFALPGQVMFPAVLGIQLFYFRLTADELEIRSHVLPWFRKRYPLTAIAAIVFESSNNWSRMLRVRTYDYRSDSFAAGTLRDRHWLALGKALKKRGIYVKSELPGVTI